jgi:hypothetical protein
MKLHEVFKGKSKLIVLVATAFITLILIGAIFLYQDVNDGVIQLGVMEDSDANAFESVRMAARKLGDEVELSNQAKIMFQGVVDEGLDLFLDDKGNFYNPSFQGVIMCIYDKDKGYQLQRNYDNSYTAYVLDNFSKNTVKEEHILNYNDYINMKDYYNSDIVDQLDFSNYYSCYIPYWNCTTEEDQATDGFTCYLYQDGKYIPLDQIPQGEYSYYKYQGISKKGVVSVTPENQGFIFYSLK